MIERSPRGAFNIRAAMACPGVPMNFKPGHLSHQNTPRGAEKDASEAFNGTLAREFRAALSMQASVPRQRCLWPETYANGVGWLVDGRSRGTIPLVDRGTMVGAVPAFGIGWRGRTAHGRRRQLGLPLEGSASSVASGADSTAPAVTVVATEPAVEAAKPPANSILLDAAKAARRITNKKARSAQGPYPRADASAAVALAVARGCGRFSDWWRAASIAVAAVPANADWAVAADD